MDYQSIKESRQLLGFSECNILKAVIDVCSKEEFLYQMHLIIQNTDQPLLIETAEKLVEKIIPLSEAGFVQLCNDIKNNTALFPPNYILPT